MILLFIKLILAHLIGDFLLQPKQWVDHKQTHILRSKFLYFHILVHLISLMFVLKFDYNYLLGITIIITSHFIIDVIKLKIKTKKVSLLSFFIDQLAHFVVIAFVVSIYTPFEIKWELIYSSKILLLLTCLIGVTRVSSILIEIFINKFSSEQIIKNVSFKHAGVYIGMFERLFVFTFIIVNYWEGIGFLIAAKLFGDVLAKDRNLYQYVLIGTFLSFGLAIAFGLGYTYVLGLIEN